MTGSAGDTFVTFETPEPYADARHITVWGNWAVNGGWLRVPMRRCADRWQVTVGPLSPGFYHYQFIVDLVAVKDPANPTTIRSEPTWSTLLVPGPEASLLAEVADGTGGRVERFEYRSGVGGARHTAYVWTPPGYDRHRREPYPVLYLQHGSGQHSSDWVEMGLAGRILDNLAIGGRIEPMVVVMAEGNVVDFPAELLGTIVGAARARYNIDDRPEGQALAGLSMGGFQAFGVLKTHPGMFGYVATFSAALLDPTGLDVEAVNRGTRLLRVYTGDQTDFTSPMVMSTLAMLADLGIRAEFAGVTPGPHGWDVWRQHLIDLLPRLFRVPQVPPVD